MKAQAAVVGTSGNPGLAQTFEVAYRIAIFMADIAVGSEPTASASLPICASAMPMVVQVDVQVRCAAFSHM